MRALNQHHILKSSPLLIVAFLFLVTSCFAPTSKKSYLLKFERFVEKVKVDHSNYTDQDWEYADKQYKKFSEDWYQKFKKDLTFEEKVKVQGLKISYKILKAGDKSKDIYKELFKEDVDKLKEKIEEYVENDMDEDLEKLIEGAEEIGDSLVQVIKGIVEEIENK